MPDRHKTPPLSIRLPDAERSAVYAKAERDGIPVRRVILDAIRAYLGERKVITREEFEAGYAERSGVTVGWLHEHGRYAEPCDCRSGECTGWAMGYQLEDAIIEDAAGG
jgi:hypothetical protein